MKTPDCFRDLWACAMVLNPVDFKTVPMMDVILRNQAAVKLGELPVLALLGVADKYDESLAQVREARRVWIAAQGDGA